MLNAFLSLRLKSHCGQKIAFGHFEPCRSRSKSEGFSPTLTRSPGRQILEVLLIRRMPKPRRAVLTPIPSAKPSFIPKRYLKAGGRVGGKTSFIGLAIQTNHVTPNC